MYLLKQKSRTLVMMVVAFGLFLVSGSWAVDGISFSGVNSADVMPGREVTISGSGTCDSTTKCGDVILSLKTPVAGVSFAPSTGKITIGATTAIGAVITITGQFSVSELTPVDEVLTVLTPIVSVTVANGDVPWGTNNFQVVPSVTLGTNVTGVSQGVAYSIGTNTGTNSASVSSSGIITLGDATKSGTFTVVATSTVDNTKTGTGTFTIISPISAVTVSPTTPSIAAGGSLDFTAAVTKVGSALGNVSWAVAGASVGTAAFSPSTASSVNGNKSTLSLGTASGTLTVTATSIDDGTKTGTATITVVAAGSVTAITSVAVGIDPSDTRTSVQAGDFIKLVRTALPANAVNKDVVWAITNTDKHAGTTIAYNSGDSSGTLTVASAETRTTLTITATSTQDGSKVGTKTISIIPKPVLSGITLAEGEERTPYSVKLTAVSSAPVTWTKTSGPAWLTFGTGTAASTLSGTPPMGSAGSSPYSVVVAATNSSGSNSATLPLTINAFELGNKVTVNFSSATDVFTGSELKIKTLPTVTVRSEAVGGKASDYWVTKLEYTGQTSTKVVTNSNLITSATANMALASTTGVTDVDTYDVEVCLENKNADVGIEVCKTSTFKVTPRDIAGATLKITALSGDEAFYDGSAKSPIYTLTDGKPVFDLKEGTDYTITTDAATKWVNAGTVPFAIKGQGNYNGTKSSDFVIKQKPIKIDATADYYAKLTKNYDGTAKVDFSDVDIEFEDLVSGETLEKGVDYTISAEKFADTKVGENKTVTATIKLIANGPVAKNYSLANTTLSTKAEILKGPATVESFKFAIPTGHLFNGKAQGIGSVAWASGISNDAIAGVSDGKFAVLYNGEAGNPINLGSYEVTVSVNEGKSFDATVVSLGTYIIGEPLSPTVVLQADTTIREGQSLNITAKGEKPVVDGKVVSGGSLAYQWYIVGEEGGDAVAVKGGTAATLKLATPKKGEYTYFVEVTYTNASVQTATKVRSTNVLVSVLDAPVSLGNARIEIMGEYIYDGTDQIPLNYNVSVTLNGNSLADSVDYTYKVSNNKTAGTGIVTVTGMNAYKETAVGTFVIEKKEVVVSDLSFNLVKTYNGAAQPVVVTAAGGKTGLGAVTVYYNGTTTVPIVADTYEVTVKVAAGMNFAATTADLELGTYTILKRLPTVSDFSFSIPNSHKWTGAEQGIGSVSFTGVGGGYGNLTVMYNGEDKVPSDSGVYSVGLMVSGGDNYVASLLSLGTYEIHGVNYVGVAGTDRDVRANEGNGAAAVVVPVASVGGITVGPNPVSKSVGSLNIYWNGTKSVKGTLVVFSAVGAKVATVSVSGTKKVGTWNVGNVAEGTYLVKGVLTTADGEKVKVSEVVGVR